MQRTSRKKEHIQYAIETGQSGQHGFADVKFVHNCIPESKYTDVSLDTSFGGLHMSSPIVINAMTGGALETYEINRRLAELARDARLAMAVGSQMAALKDPSVRNSYTVVRKVNPGGIIFANLGAEANEDQARQAVEMIEADALQIHLNVMQELIMPEGDRDFTGVRERIQAIVEAVPCPVIVKEVGFGISRESAHLLVQTGIHALDVGGSGGTNFAKIENCRREIPLDMFNDWGLTTVQSLLEVSDLNNKVDIMATGGITTGLDMAKAFALGASVVGLAGYFLRLVTAYEHKQALEAVNHLHQQIRMVMTALGIKRIDDFNRCPIVITGNSYHWAEMRGIDCRKFSYRIQRGDSI